MAEELEFEGKQYISSKRASELSGYAQDYIGQLSRKNLIDARRVGGLWYVLWDSLKAYQSKAEAYKPEPPVNTDGQADPEAFISFAGRNYLSAARAAKSTGYHQDYIGQLARSGKILSRRIGNRWYVDHDALLAHKAEKDALLGSVQAQSVGINSAVREIPHLSPSQDDGTYFTYVSEKTPDFRTSGDRDAKFAAHPWESEPEKQALANDEHQIPIRIINTIVAAEPHSLSENEYRPSRPSRSRGRRAFLIGSAVAAVAFAGLVFWRVGTTQEQAVSTGDQIASAGGLPAWPRAVAESIEKLINPGVTYTRQK